MSAPAAMHPRTYRGEISRGVAHRRGMQEVRRYSTELLEGWPIRVPRGTPRATFLAGLGVLAVPHAWTRLLGGTADRSMAGAAPNSSTARSRASAIELLGSRLATASRTLV